MNAEKYTQKTLDAVKTAQSMAQENGNQYLTPEHLLYALGRSGRRTHRVALRQDGRGLRRPALRAGHADPASAEGLRRQR